VRLLRSSYDPARFNGAHLDFEVYLADDFSHAMEQGVSLFLYRVQANGTYRTPAGQTVTGGRQRTRLPLDLFFLLTVWAKKSTLQQEVTGWMMRVLEDHPTLPAGLLNAYRPKVFDPDEAVELTLGQLSLDDLFHIWELTINRTYQLSLPYVARLVRIDSEFATTEAGPVQERLADFRQLERAG
jgi:hypothetical protein